MALTVRESLPEDSAQVLALMALSLGWRPDEPQQEFFRWKHEENPFGVSPGWVAVDEERVVGFRTFMRWEFVRAGRVLRAVRAVDTATHPDHQGRGIFRTLTLHALDALRDEGVAFVFNTPNDNSRPGYLKMGWQPVGTLPVAMRPRGMTAVPAVLRARVPAQRWSVPCSAGLPAIDVLAMPGVHRLLSGVPGEGLQTHRSREYLLWRYSFAALRYRALLLGERADEGLVVFRVRRRGSATEAAIAEVLLPEGPAPRGLVRRVLRVSGADYAVALRPSPPGMLPVPGQGPLLVWRALSEDSMPALADWTLTLGDIELF